MRVSARFLTICGALLSTVLVRPALAADYPDHPVQLIVPFDVGGASDVLSRIVATNLTKLLGQTFLVVNKPGAAANIGILPPLPTVSAESA